MFGIIQLEWDSPALTAESWGLPTVKLTWNPEGITPSTLIDQLPPPDIITIVLHE